MTSRPIIHRRCAVHCFLHTPRSCHTNHNRPATLALVSTNGRVHHGGLIGTATFRLSCGPCLLEVRKYLRRSVSHVHVGKMLS